MKKIRYGLIVMSMLLCWANFASAQVSIGIGLPNVSIGINLPLYPDLVRVPGYPVYYAPQMNANYFFYDGMYWVFQDDNWYASTWYNGPWSYVEPEVVPLFVLRIPVSYYRQPPVYFSGWQSNAPPRWGQHWGHGWEQQRRGWDRWKRSYSPAPAPLPVYQRKYSGDRYPRVEQQHTLVKKSYRYQPRDRFVRDHLKQKVEHKATPVSNPRQQDMQRSRPPQQGAPTGPRTQPPQRSGEHVQKSAPPQAAPHQRVPVVREQKQQPRDVQREQRAPKVQEKRQKPQDKGDSKEPKQGRGQGQNKDDERGRGRN